MAANTDVTEIYGIGYTWLCNYGDTHALTIPGYRVRSYLAKCDAYVKTRYIVNVYIGKKHIMQELLCWRPNTQREFVPFAPEAIANVFSDMEMFKIAAYWGRDYPWWKKVAIKCCEGRILFKFDKSFWKNQVCGVNLDFMPFTFAGLMLRKFGPMLTYATICKDKLKTFKDVKDVWSAIRGISISNWKRSGHYEKAIAKLREKIVEQSKEKAEASTRLEYICNHAADAMNELSDRFGITVSV